MTAKSSDRPAAASQPSRARTSACATLFAPAGGTASRATTSIAREEIARDCDARLPFSYRNVAREAAVPRQINSFKFPAPSSDWRTPIAASPTSSTSRNPMVIEVSSITTLCSAWLVFLSASVVDPFSVTATVVWVRIFCVGKAVDGSAFCGA